MRHALVLLMFFFLSLFLVPTAQAQPAAPSNLIVAEVAGGIQLTWNDNSGDELGFYVYRDGFLRVDTTYSSMLDTDLAPGVRYCYQVDSFAPYYESAKTPSSCVTYTGTVGVIPTPVNPGDAQPAFDYPVRTEIIYRGQKNIPADAWYDYQPFAALFNFSTKVHLGIDLNKGGGDANEPLYSVADCLIHNFDDTAASTAWGKWLMLRCDTAAGKVFRLANGSTTSRVYVMYAHLGEIRIVSDKGVITLPGQITKDSTKVSRGWQVATVGNANGYYGTAYHLHFEVRVNETDLAGPGYVTPDTYSFLQSHADPLEFIDNNRFYDQKELRVVIHSQDIDRSLPNHVELSPALWKRTGRTEVSEKRSLGYNDYFWLADSKSGSQASWNFHVPLTGNWEVYLHLPHTYATASQVRYTVWHEDLRFPNPYVFDFNQARGSADNQRVYVGTFNFNTGKEYAIAIAGLTDEVNRKQIALDALELVAYRNDGIGGAVTLTDGDQDGMGDDWEAEHGLNPMFNDSQEDPDDDGLVNLAEYYLNTDPQRKDSDGDGEDDNSEFLNHYDPTDSSECSLCNGSSPATNPTVPVTDTTTSTNPQPVTQTTNDDDSTLITDTTAVITEPPIANDQPVQASQPSTDQTGRIYNVTINNQGNGFSCNVRPLGADDFSSLAEALMLVYLLFCFSLYLRIRRQVIKTARATRGRRGPPGS